MSRRQWASYQIRKIAGCACAGNVGIVFPHPRFQRKPLVNDPDMHHGTCVTHVPWCMSGSLTCGDGENVPGIPGACAPAILRIWQEAHGWNKGPLLCWLKWLRYIRFHLYFDVIFLQVNRPEYDIWVYTSYCRRHRITWRMKGRSLNLGVMKLSPGLSWTSLSTYPTSMWVNYKNKRTYLHCGFFY